MAEKTTFSQSVIPAAVTNQANDINAKQAEISNRGYTTYGGPRIQGFTDAQKQGFDATRNAAFSFQPGLDFAKSATETAMGRSTTGALAPLMGNIVDSSGQQGALTGLANADEMNRAAMDPLGIRMAQPFLDKASGSAVDNIDQYMNPFMDQVLSRFAEQGERNLRENLIPGATSKFINAGQLSGGPARGGGAGAPSGLMTDTARALRDTQEAVLKQQADLQMQGWDKSLAASQADLSRFGNLASTAGNLGLGQQQVLGTAANTGANIAGRLSDIDFGNRGLMKDAANIWGNAYSGDTANMFTGAGQMSDLASKQQSMGLAGASAITGIGDKEQALGQAGLDVAKADWDKQMNWDQQQLDARSRTFGSTLPAYPTGQMSYENSKTPKASTLQNIAGMGAMLAGSGAFK